MSRDVSEQSLALAVWCWRLRCDHACSHPREEAIAFLPTDLHLISGKGTYRHECQRFAPMLQARAPIRDGEAARE